MNGVPPLVLLLLLLFPDRICGHGNGIGNVNGNPDSGLFGDSQEALQKGAEKSSPDSATSPSTSTIGTSFPFPVPEGPYIVAGVNSSERVVIPDPPRPDPTIITNISNCPHLQSGLKRWHDPQTWVETASGTSTSTGTGGIPQEGQSVTLPQNTKVLIDQSIDQVLGFITIPRSSQLIIGSNTTSTTSTSSATHIQLQAHGIQVFGELHAGSDTCRIHTNTNITITLHGTRPSSSSTTHKTPQPPPAEHIKGISVNGGTLSLHGKRFYPTWTRLAKTIQVGHNVILLQHRVSWDPGAKIVLVTTAMKDSREWHQNEILTVQAVHNNANNNNTQFSGALIVTLERARYRHIATTGYQAEVGLLSRTITIQGAPHDSDPVDPDPLNCTISSGRRSNYGNRDRPCSNTELTGYGGHVIVWNGGKGYVQGVQLYRMGQTNILGNYPIHFHLLGDECATCYVKDCSIWRSYYRCVSIHGTNNLTVQENVAFNVVGYCYYLEDGVEENNTLAFNLAAHIHLILPMGIEPPWGSGQRIEPIVERDDLILPADVTASGFYITNVHNRIIGNAASGGWAGFAFPSLPQALQTHRYLNFRPSTVTSLEIDGNTAHSSGWWWGNHAGAFYFGGTLYYNHDDKLEYNPGRDFNFTHHGRWPCQVNSCQLNSACHRCSHDHVAWNLVTNSKVFLVPGVGFNSWHGRMEVMGYETHDVGLALESLSNGFFLTNMLAVCRSGEPMALPPGASMTRVRGDGFFWYDTTQEHILTDVTFRKCGYRSAQFNQYDNSPDRGCGNEPHSGCSSRSSVFGFRVHSNEHSPEVMQATSRVTFERCGRRFYLYNYHGTDHAITVSGRGQAWLDVDGSAAGTGYPTLIGSGFDEVKDWWGVDDEVVYDPQGPLRFIRQHRKRGIGHINLLWDTSIHDLVGGQLCGNTNGAPCPQVGTIRHMGPKFSPYKEGNASAMVVTANAEIIGPVGGFGWLLELDQGAPKTLRVDYPEIMPVTPLVLSIAYPVGTKITITQHATRWCRTSSHYACSEEFTSVGSVMEVRNGLGNTYHLDSDGLLTVRIIQGPRDFVGCPDWFLPSYEDSGRNGGFAWARFERDGVILPMAQSGPYLLIEADCDPGGTNNAYCQVQPSRVDPRVCPDMYEQVAFDACCRMNDDTDCIYA